MAIFNLALLKQFAPFGRRHPRQSREFGLVQFGKLHDAIAANKLFGLRRSSKALLTEQQETKAKAPGVEPVGNARIAFRNDVGKAAVGIRPQLCVGQAILAKA